MKKRKIVGSAIVGNIVEYYDFGVYAVFAATIGSLFFPSFSKVSQILLAFSIFALGFFMRPLGGIIFGHIGDSFGRRTALTISIVGMAICTLMIGMLPGYATLGVMAPILLTVIRLMQGICVGGEGAGSAIFILEHLNGYRPGLIGSIVMASNMLGTLLAYFVGFIVLEYFGPDFWRVGFFLGALMGLSGLYLRFQLSETPIFQNAKEENLIEKKPLLKAFKSHWQRMLVVAFLGAVTSVIAYMIRAFLKTYLKVFLGYTSEESLTFTLLALFIMIITMPFFGLISDKTGYRKFILMMCYITIFASLPIFMMLSSAGGSYAILLLAITLLSLIASAICAPAYQYAISAFSPELRYSGVAFSWNAGIAIFGGTTAAISTYLVNSFGNIAPAYYMISIAVAFIAIAYLTRKQSH